MIWQRRPAAVREAGTAARGFVPLTVEGGIRTPDGFSRLLRAGADRPSVNSAAVRDPGLISRAAERFGSQCVVLAIDARKRPDGLYEVVAAGGRSPAGIDAIRWPGRGQTPGAVGNLPAFACRFFPGSFSESLLRGAIRKTRRRYRQALASFSSAVFPWRCRTALPPVLSGVFAKRRDGAPSAAFASRSDLVPIRS